MSAGHSAPAGSAPRVPAGPNSLAARANPSLYSRPVVELDLCAAPPWINTAGENPDLAGYIFVYARYEGETREEAEAYHDGYGQSVESVDWHKVIEYRRKRHPVSL